MQILQASEVGLPWMASGAHQAALSFCLLQAGKENTKRKLLGGDEDRGTTHQLLSREKTDSTWEKII